MGWISKSQQERDHKGLRNICAACGHAPTALNKLVKTTTGSRVHKSHITDPNSGFYGKGQ